MPRRIIRPRRKPSIPPGLTVLQLSSVPAIIAFLVFLASRQIEYAQLGNAPTPAVVADMALVGLAALAVFAVPAAIHAQRRAGRHVLMAALTYLTGYLLGSFAADKPLLAAGGFVVVELIICRFLYRSRTNVSYFEALD